MLPKELNHRRMTDGTPKLGRASLKPSSNRYATDIGPDDQPQIVLQTEVAMFEELIMQGAEADRVRQFPARVGPVSPTCHVTGNEQAGIVGIAHSTVPTIVRECQAPQRVMTDAQPRLTNLDSDRYVGYDQRIARDCVLDDVIGQVLTGQVDSLICQHVDAAGRKEESALVPQLLEYTTDGLGRCLADRIDGRRHREQPSSRNGLRSTFEV